MPATAEEGALHESCAVDAPPGEPARPVAETLAAYRRHSPYRRLDWRWQRAAELLRFGEEPDPRHDDSWTHRAVAFQRLSADCPAESLAQAMPDICAAFQLHTLGGAPCWEVQARILARETTDCIETKTGNPSVVVQCYEKLFFAVLDRIDIPTYIESAALTELPLSGDDVVAVWSHCGYWYGPYLLDEVIEDFRQSGKPDYTHLMTKSDWWKRRSRFQRLLDRTIGLLLFKLSNNNLTALLQLERVVSTSVELGQHLSQHVGSQDVMDEAMFELFATVSHDDMAAGSPDDLAA